MFKTNISISSSLSQTIRFSIFARFLLSHNFYDMHGIEFLLLVDIGYLTSHSTILQWCIWQHIDMLADWRGSWTYGRAPNARHFVGFFNVLVQAPTRDHLFYGYSDTTPTGDTEDIFSSLNSGVLTGSWYLSFSKTSSRLNNYNILRYFLHFALLFYFSSYTRDEMGLVNRAYTYIAELLKYINRYGNHESPDSRFSYLDMDIIRCRATIRVPCFMKTAIFWIYVVFANYSFCCISGIYTFEEIL